MNIKMVDLGFFEYDNQDTGRSRDHKWAEKGMWAKCSYYQPQSQV